MSLHLVTGHKGQAHVTAEDHGAFNAGILGDLEAILNIGEKFMASAIDANTVRIYNGELVMQGRHVRIVRDEYEDVVIDNGAQGMKRNDLIVVRYTKDPTIGVENAEFAVLKGTETTGTPVDPTPTTGDILSETCLLHEMPLYRIRLNGINVEAVELLAEVLPTFNEICLLVNPEADYVVERGTSGGWEYRKWNSGTAECWANKDFSVEVTSAYGSGYFARLWNGVTLPPDLFITYPVVEMKVHDTNADCWVSNRAGDSVNLGVASVLSLTSGIKTGTVSIHCIGRCK